MEAARRRQLQAADQLLANAIKSAVYNSLDCKDSVERDAVSVSIEGTTARVSIAHSTEAAAQDTLSCIDDDEDFASEIEADMGELLVTMSENPQVVRVERIPPSPPPAPTSPSPASLIIDDDDTLSVTTDDGLSTGALVGIIIGCMLGGMILMVVAGYAYVLFLRKEKAHQVMLKASNSGKDATTSRGDPHAGEDEPTSSSTAANLPA